MNGPGSRTAFPTWASCPRSRRRPKAAAASWISCRPSGKCSRSSTAIAPCGASRRSLAGPISKSPRRCSGSRAPASSCWWIRGQPSAGVRAPRASSPSRWRKRSARSSPRTSTPPAPPPSKPAVCSRTTRRFISCSAASTWRRGTRPPLPRSCGARCGSIRCSPRRIATWDSPSSRWAGSAKPSKAGTSGSAWRARQKRRRTNRTCSAPAKPRECSAMADEIRALSAQLAQDPQSLVFLRLGEALRRKGQLDSATRVAMNGLERHPHLADAHDLYARILTDKHDYARAFDEWDMAVRIAPNHTGALKGLAFLYFKVGDIAQAETHLEQARKVEPDDPTIDQAFEMIRGGHRPPSPTPAPAPTPSATAATAASGLDETRVFAGLEGANEGLLLIDGAGRVLGGSLRDRSGSDVTDSVAAYLAGVSQEAARTAKLLGLGAWNGLSAEGQHGNVHLAHPTPEALLLVVRERGTPLGRLAILAQRATSLARRWLEQQ